MNKYHKKDESNGQQCVEIAESSLSAKDNVQSKAVDASYEGGLGI